MNLAPHQQSLPMDREDAYRTTLTDLASALAGAVSEGGTGTTTHTVRPHSASVRPRARVLPSAGARTDKGGDPEPLVPEHIALDSRFRGNEREIGHNRRSGRPEAEPEPHAHDRVPGLGNASPGTTGDGSTGIILALRECAARIRTSGQVARSEWPALYHAAIDVLNAAEFVREGAGRDANPPDTLHSSP